MALSLLATATAGRCAEPAADVLWPALADGQFAWRASAPLVAFDLRATDTQVSIKDPTVVFHDGRWHLFCTVRFQSGKVDIIYTNFADWSQADLAPRQVLKLHDQYYCAPQVFFFRPHNCWYLVYQLADDGHQPPFGPCFSKTTTLADPRSWSPPEWMFPDGSEARKWLDFWVICAADKAHLFYTSLDGQMWRSETPLDKFPHGWSEPVVAIQGDIFEASHTYRVRGWDKYLTLVEAQGDRRRYYKAFVAEHLEGPWKGLADRPEQPFAAFSNVQQSPEWTTNVSHGELLRAGTDERLEIDPANVRFLFQGASDTEYRSNRYGMIPWRLGMLEAIPRE